MTTMIAMMKAAAFWYNGKSMKILLSSMEEDRKKADTEENFAILRQQFSKLFSEKNSDFQAKLAQAVKKYDVLTRYAGTIEERFNGLLLVQMVCCTGQLCVQSFQAILALVDQKEGFLLVHLLFLAVYTSGVMVHIYLYCYIGQKLFTETTEIADAVYECECGQVLFFQSRTFLQHLENIDGRDLQAELARIVKKHDTLNRFANIIEERFNGMLLMQMLGCTVQLCVQCFQAILSLTVEKNGFFLVQISFLALYISYVLLQVYLYCYIGERLFSESTEIANAAYECDCHALFSDILKTSMGYLSVLYAMRTNEEE
ncbi:hypothetical protein KPH14_004382 [Odynerus spinipes]|uniref:Odorant receptor n=1 Tax=Odynerus spinipes TaxID=1348599 RepID=A0AAD9RZG2_9HYME|nr:hypothetical protein KPH14_004382 [Odynerus spinipes]